jgi:hypothetical protein
VYEKLVKELEDRQPRKKTKGRREVEQSAKS